MMQKDITLLSCRRQDSEHEPVAACAECLNVISGRLYLLEDRITVLEKLLRNQAELTQSNLPKG